jgi:hypothetical protein
VVLFLSFAFNIFGVGVGDPAASWFTHFQKDSEALIVGKVTCDQQLGKDKFGGMLTAVKGTDAAPEELAPTCQPGNLTAYDSQYGLQGKIAELGYAALHWLPGVTLARFFAFAQLCWALFTALVLSVFVVWVAEVFSPFSASVTLALFALSTWVVGFARNLYWATPLLFLPLIYTLLYYRQPKRSKSYFLFLGGLFILIFLRLLNGYEFTPEVILIPVVAMAFLIFPQDSSLKTFVKQAAPLCAVGVLAFMAAFGMNFYQVDQYVGNGHDAFKLIEDRAFQRTAAGSSYEQYVYPGLDTTLPDVYAALDNYMNMEGLAARKQPVITDALSLLNYALLPVVSLPIALNEPLYTIVSSFTFVVILTFLAIRSLKHVRRKDSVKIHALYRTLWVGLIGALTWLVLGHAHTLAHAHLDGIIFYLPFLPFAFIALSLWLEQFIGRTRARNFLKRV